MKPISELFSLDGRTAIVTGASRGIGAALAAGAAAAGAIVTAIARSPRPGGELPRSVEYEPCDITDTQQFAKVCDTVMHEHRRLDILVNCAGISLPFDRPDELFQNFHQTLEVNLAATFRCMSTARERMTLTGAGSIINVCSLASILGFPNNPGYVASKGGLLALTRAAAVDWAADGIRVNNLIPGYIRTAMTEGSFNDAERHRRRLERTLLGRWGEPADLIGAMIFLASDASAYMTGQDVIVDGGWAAKGL